MSGSRFRQGLFLRSLLVTVFLCGSAWSQDVQVGSKKFTESVILGELLAHLARDAGVAVEHRKELGGTRVLWGALLNGDIDAYAEYTGTISQEILAGQNVETAPDMRRALGKLHVMMTDPLGFNNTYAFGMNEADAERLGIRTISDLVKHPDLVFGFTNEFMDRGDGWPSLQAVYNLPHKNVSGLDHDLAYRGLKAGSIQLMDLYSTDAEIKYYGLRTLIDDLSHFPVYNAVIVYRSDLADRHPGVVASFRRLPGRVGAPKMIAMNARVKLGQVPDTQVAADFLSAEFAVRAEVTTETWVDRLVKNSRTHLYLVVISLSAAILVAIPLGIAAVKLERFGQLILGFVGVLQTIPSLALLVFMIPLLGIGGPPAIVALFVYSLLPIVRSTHAGMIGIPGGLQESAIALGLPASARLRLVELPMASRSILSGIKTAAVINVGTATLGALIGAGGYGQPILTGIRLDNVGLILEGAVPAAVLALLVQGVFDLADRVFVSKGLRLVTEA
jgi:osmoprotectant transport system permease protein